MEGPGGRQYPRNRRYLKPVQLPPTTSLNDDDDDNNVETRPVEQETVEQPNSQTQQVVSSRGRIIKPPSRYQDL